MSLSTEVFGPAGLAERVEVVRSNEDVIFRRYDGDLVLQEEREATEAETAALVANEDAERAEAEAAEAPAVERSLRLAARVTLAPVLAAEDTLTASEIEDMATLFPAWETDTAYAVDDVASFGGRLWECRQAHTSQDDWTPPEVLALWYKYRGVDDPDETPAWEAATPYGVGDLVTYQGTTYRCRQAHTSIVTWEPPNVPALWEVA